MVRQYNKLIEQKERIKLNCQLRMYPERASLIFFYQEGVISLGYIAFFAFNFPLAPLIVFINLFFEIKIKLDDMSRSRRRITARPAVSIGGW